MAAVLLPMALASDGNHGVRLLPADDRQAPPLHATFALARSGWRRRSLVAVASTCACAGWSLISHRQRRPRPRCSLRAAVATEVAAETLPTDYYGLLGLPRFASDPVEIKAAHRRVVKLVHPDVLGGSSEQLQRLVTQAYETLGDEVLKAAYDRKLGGASASAASSSQAGGSLGRSQWHPEAPEGAEGVFVDETQCVICHNCTTMAPETFEIDSEDRGRARVFMQYGDWAEDIEEAVQSCPTSAIAYVSREMLPYLEHVMPDTEMEPPHVMMRRRSGNMSAGGTPPGPYELAMRYRQRKQDREEMLGGGPRPDGQRRGGAQGPFGREISETAEAIRRAVGDIPVDVQKRAWPEKL